jgi:predicted TPR repeat methyltransferase
MSSGDLIADRRYRFGRELLARGDVAGAIDLFAQAAEVAPGFAAAWFALGAAREKAGDRPGAVAAFSRAREADPADRCGAALRLARLGAADAPGAMSPAYVCMLFDQYAPRFDTAVEGLAYQAPARLRRSLLRARPDAVFDRMLDLGCGSGLVGEALRPHARHITGVDLSPGMLAQARGKGIYGRLETGDLLVFLAAEATRTYDLVIAADVFVYVFDLAPVGAEVARVLRPGGLFAFTVETHSGSGVVLGEALRFRHGADHVRAALADFRLIELSPVTTRTEAKAGVPGLLAVAAAGDG